MMIPTTLEKNLLLSKVDRLPSRTKMKPVSRRDGMIIIMEGEATGHHHVITDKGATLWTLECNGKVDIYLEVAEPVVISHDEHKPLPIPPGIYQVGQVREYDYFADMERQVVD
jgi:hypothetical protein